QRLLGQRTRELAGFLEDHFELRTPREWVDSLASSAHGAGAHVFEREFDDEFLRRVLDLEEHFATPPYLMVEGYRGYNVVFYRGRLYGLEQSLGEVRVDEFGASELGELLARGDCVRAESLAEVKRGIDAARCGRRNG